MSPEEGAGREGWVAPLRARSFPFLILHPHFPPTASSQTGMSGIPTATVTMVGPDGISRYCAATGTGPVDAVYKAVDALVGTSVTLETYAMQAVNEGIGEKRWNGPFE